ncbi:MAG: ferritin-like domain-containing protein [Chitinophagaceae bacterium]
MNFYNIFGEIEKADPEVYDRLDTRRAAMKGFANLGGKLALAAVPIALGSMFKKAYAGSKSTSETVLQILNYALTLEYLEAEFYTTALSKGILLIPAGAATAAITTISNHETQHVSYLKTAIAPLGTAVAKPTFDFSGGSGSGTGPFLTVFTDYPLFLAVAQTLEDTGVRAYKGRAAELVKGGDLLTAVLNIHSVEARHASHIRQMRKASGVDVKPWITGIISGIPAGLVEPNYIGEDNTKQATIEIVNINSMAISTNAATEAFDEGLTKDQVLAIVTKFIKP